MLDVRCDKFQPKETEESGKYVEFWCLMVETEYVVFCYALIPIVT